jgi:ketosteroid isomerase-like protein
MPFVDISLTRGKSAEYIEGVSRAVHQALVGELGMKPDDNFQIIHQYEPGEMVFNRTFRGGPRSDDWIVFQITDGPQRGEPAKRRFYKRLVQLLHDGPGIRPEDTFVMMTVTPSENFSFANGTIGTDVVSVEALDAALASPGTQARYSHAEMAYAITELFDSWDRRYILPMLRDDFVMKIPATLPYGGEIVGPEAFSEFFSGTPGGEGVWESFTPHVEEVIDSDTNLIARLTNTGVPKATGQPMQIQNLWLFKTAGGRIVSAQLYADTAAAAAVPR